MNLFKIAVTNTMFAKFIQNFDTLDTKFNLGPPKQKLNIVI